MGWNARVRSGPKSRPSPTLVPGPLNKLTRNRHNPKMTSTMNATERRKRQLEDTIDVHFQDIRKSFGDFDVLKGINLEIRRG